MLKKLMILLGTSMLAGCAISPGMDRMDTSQFPRYDAPNIVHAQPVLIPITPSLLVLQGKTPYHYLVGARDVLNISVWQHPEFDPSASKMPVATASLVQGSSAGQPGYLVNTDGNIYFPLIGTTHVSGKTVEQIRQQIARKLSRYVRNPQINVRVNDYRSKKIYVLGEIMRPGLIPLNDQPMSIVDALSKVGSMDPNSADPRHIYVIRGGFIKPHIFWLKARTPDAFMLAEGFQLKAGDVIFVSTAPVSRWNRTINQILPGIQTFWYAQGFAPAHTS